MNLKDIFLKENLLPTSRWCHRKINDMRHCLSRESYGTIALYFFIFLKCHWWLTKGDLSLKFIIIVRAVFVHVLVSNIWKPNGFTNFYENKTTKMISEVVIIRRKRTRDLKLLCFFNFFKNVPNRKFSIQQWYHYLDYLMHI